jgi:hypothetical protein
MAVGRQASLRRLVVPSGPVNAAAIIDHLAGPLDVEGEHVAHGLAADLARLAWSTDQEVPHQVAFRGVIAGGR